MNVHNIGIDHPDFKSAVMDLICRYNGFKLKRLLGQFRAYRHCFNGDVTLEMLQQSKHVVVEDARKAIRVGEEETPKELKIRLDDNMRIIVPVDEHLKISLSEKSFMLNTKTGVIMGRRLARAEIDRSQQRSRSREIRSYKRQKKYERERRKEVIMIHQLAMDAPGVSVVSAEPCEDSEGRRCVRLTMSNGRRAFMY